MIPTDAWLILSEVKPIECAWMNFTPDLNGYEIIRTYSRNIYGFVPGPGIIWIDFRKNGSQISAFKRSSLISRYEV